MDVSLVWYQSVCYRHKRSSRGENKLSGKMPHNTQHFPLWQPSPAAAGGYSPLTGPCWLQTWKTNGLAGSLMESRLGTVGLQWHFPHMQNHAKGKYWGGGIPTLLQNMAVTSVMSSLADRPTQATVAYDWTRSLHVSVLLYGWRVDHGLISMTSIVHWVRCVAWVDSIVTSTLKGIKCRGFM